MTEECASRFCASVSSWDVLIMFAPCAIVAFLFALVVVAIADS